MTHIFKNVYFESIEPNSLWKPILRRYFLIPITLLQEKQNEKPYPMTQAGGIVVK